MQDAEEDSRPCLRLHSGMDRHVVPPQALSAHLLGWIQFPPCLTANMCRCVKSSFQASSAPLTSHTRAGVAVCSKCVSSTASRGQSAAPTRGRRTIPAGDDVKVQASTGSSPVSFLHLFSGQLSLCTMITFLANLDVTHTHAHIHRGEHPFNRQMIPDVS